MEKVYYLKQDAWTCDDFYYLNRYLNRMFIYAEKYEEEIKSLDITKMSIETKTIIRCLLEFQHKECFMDKYPNLKELKNIGPLKTPIYLENPPSYYHDVYTKYNILW